MGIPRDITPMVGGPILIALPLGRGTLVDGTPKRHHNSQRNKRNYVARAETLVQAIR